MSNVSCHSVIPPSLFLLETLLKQEKELTRNPLPKGEGLVTANERDATVKWLCNLARGAATGGGNDEQVTVKFASDTLCLAVACLDRILTTTRVQSKYLHCLSLASLYLATKLCEEPEQVPSVRQMVQLAGARYSTQELLRMERVVLSRLDWQLSFPTMDRFLQLMLAISLPVDVNSMHLLSGTHPQKQQSMVTDLRRSLDTVLSSHRLMICTDLDTVMRENCADLNTVTREVFSTGYRSSLLALAILSLTLESRRHPQWLAITWNLQQLIKADPDELIRCREKVSARITKQQLRSLSTGMDKENTRITAPIRRASADVIGKTSRKRLRKQSKSSESSCEMVPRVRTPPENMFIDEISDSQVGFEFGSW